MVSNKLDISDEALPIPFLCQDDGRWREILRDSVELLDGVWKVAQVGARTSDALEEVLRTILAFSGRSPNSHIQATMTGISQDSELALQ